MTGSTQGRGFAEIASDPGAFERFYREHVEAVQRFVARRVDDPHVVADLTADVFVAAIASAGSHRPARGGSVPWLFGIARNVVSEQRRRGAREAAAQARIRGRDLVAEDDLAALHARIDAGSAARGLQGELRRLPPGERAVLELVAIDGLGVAEAARALGVSPVAARVRLHRARRALRERLDAPPIDHREIQEVPR